MRQTISDYISTIKKDSQAESVSFYFNDLNAGQWTGVDENAFYDPSSMLKVAIMVGYYKKYETEPTALNQKLYYDAKVKYQLHYQPQRVLQSGYYTVRELIDSMIIDSDNQAMEVLYKNDRQSFVDVLKHLNIPPPKTITDIDFMSPRIYSRIYRSLFSSTYLNRQDSEEVLKILSFTTFEKGIVSGVQASTTISHKFGEHTSLDTAGNTVSTQLHDCGIVYDSKKPYFVCVMTRGHNFENLETIISTISKKVNDYIHQN